MDETFSWGPDDKVRIKTYKKIFNELDQKKYKYDKEGWRHNVLDKRDWEKDWFDLYWAKDNFINSYWHRFQEAVIWYRDMALQTLKPLYQEAGLPV